MVTTGDGNFSNEKSEGQGRPRIRQRSSGQDTYNAPPKSNKKRVSNHKPQGGNGGWTVGQITTCRVGPSESDFGKVQEWTTKWTYEPYAGPLPVVQGSVYRPKSLTRNHDQPRWIVDMVIESSFEPWKGKVQVEQPFSVRETPGDQVIAHMGVPLGLDMLNQWKEEKAIDAGPIDWEKFKVAFLDRFFSLDMREAKLVRDVHRLARLGIQLVDSTKECVIVHNSYKSSFVMDVKAKQAIDPILVELKEAVLKKSIEAFSQGGEGVLRYRGRLCVPNVEDLREWILEEAHSSWYSIHPRATKMYRELREVYWWKGMKKYNAEFIAKCPYCQQVKVEHQMPGGPSQIFRRVGKVAYELELPNDLASMHPVFHVSMLQKCDGHPTSIIFLEWLGVDESFSYEAVSIEILDRQVKKLRNKEVASVKVLWRNHLVEGATWEAEDDMKSR
ncbi:hypothetical protein MTR67_043357 [Solanum verrucosum]|uniref:Uncharacterized protein n=1 Tax=Solanum verrucosum TaxID=315347 RepID=A0AAF0UP95_SOLVR|nr:hypothetical protein MTR67_043357 [Solanum verrucosum]